MTHSPRPTLRPRAPHRRHGAPGAHSARGNPRTRRPAVLLSLLVAALLALLTACGGGEEAPGTTSPSGPVSGFPVTVQGTNGDVTIDAAPERIVSLSPTATEMLFALGAGAQVVAVDDQSSYPENAPRTKLSGFQPNVEAVAGYDPDLVVLATDSNGIVAALATLDVPVLQLDAPTTLEGSYDQLRALGAAVGHADDADKLADDIEERIAAAAASVPAEAKGWKVYHELDPTFYSATSRTYIGSVYQRLGLTNIADDAPGVSGDYPQLSAEYVVRAAPDVIVLADTQCCGQSPATVAERPAFSGIPAVRSGRVIPADDDIASRWGPRTADFAEAVAAALAG